MIDIKDKLKTPTSKEVLSFIDNLGGADKASEMLKDIIPPVPRFHASWLKDKANKHGIRCGYIDIMYTDGDTEKKRENATSFAMNVFYTTDTGKIYYSPTFGSYVFQSETPDGYLYFSPKYYKELPIKDGLDSNKMSKTMTVYHSKDGNIDYVGWEMEIWSVKHIEDYDRSISSSPMDRVVRFVGNIETPDKIYNTSEQQCLDYAIQTRKKAVSKGIKCGIVTLFMGWEIDPQTYLPQNLAGNHVMNVFETNDMGLVYIEPQLRNGFSDTPAIGKNIQIIINDIYARLDYKYKRAPIVQPSGYIVYFQQFIW
jgi:hypothetical protein